MAASGGEFGGNDTRSPLQAAAGTYVIRILGTVAGLGSVVVVSRALGPDGRGVFSLATVLATTLLVIGKLGIDQANVYLYGTRRISTARLAGQNGLLSLAVGLSAIPVALLLRMLAPGLLGGLAPAPLIVAASTVGLVLHSQLEAGLLGMEGRVYAGPLGSAAAAVFQLVVTAGVAAAGRLDPVVALAIAGVSHILLWGITAASSRGLPRIRMSLDGPLLRESVWHALPLHVAGVSLFLHFRVDTFVLGALSGTAAVGIYSVAVAVAEGLILAADAIALALLPRQSAAGERDAARMALGALGPAIALVVVPGFVLFLLGPSALSFVFGSPFAESWLPTILLLPGAASLAAQRICGPAVLRAGQPWVLAGIFGASFGMNLVLNLVLVPRFGASGSAASSSVSYAASALAVGAWTWRLSKGRPAW